RDWSSDVCSSDLGGLGIVALSLLYIGNDRGHIDDRAHLPWRLGPEGGQDIEQDGHGGRGSPERPPERQRPVPFFLMVQGDLNGLPHPFVGDFPKVPEGVLEQLFQILFPHLSLG